MARDHTIGDATVSQKALQSCFVRLPDMFHRIANELVRLADVVGVIVREDNFDRHAARKL